MSANGSTRAWRQLRARVIAEEPVCRLRLPGCTHLSTTADHIIPISVQPELRYVRANVQGACASCNYKRGHMPISMLDQLRCASTESVNSKSNARQRDPAPALGFFSGKSADSFAVPPSVRESRNDSNCDVAQHDRQQEPPCIGA